MSGTRSQPKSKVQGPCQVSGFRALDIGCVRLLLAAQSRRLASGGSGSLLSPTRVPWSWVSRSSPVLKLYIFNQPPDGGCASQGLRS